MKLSSKRFGSVLSVNERYGHLAMMTFSLLVAGSFSFGKLIAPKIDPVSLTAARFFFRSAFIVFSFASYKALSFQSLSKAMEVFCFRRNFCNLFHHNV